MSETLLFNISYIGTGALTFFGFLKKLRNNNLLWVLGILTFILGVTGYLLSSSSVGLIPERLSYLLFGPFIYILVYSILRRVYIKIYNLEPSYDRHSLYDVDDGRKLNAFDVCVYVLPMICSFIIPVLTLK